MAEGQSNAEQYKDIEEKTSAYKTITRLNKQRKELEAKGQTPIQKYTDKANSIESKIKGKVDSFTGGVKKKQKQFSSQGKNQLESLTELFFTSAIGTGSTSAEIILRDVFIQTTNNSLGKIKEILSTEMVSALGCSQEQQFIAQTIDIKIESLDIFGKTLQCNNQATSTFIGGRGISTSTTTGTISCQTWPETPPGKYLFEIGPFSPNKLPYAFNKELYNRTQKEGQSYLDDYGIPYLGRTGQGLFNITFVPSGGTSGVYRVDLLNRTTGNKVVDFLNDYLDTIDVLDLNQVYKNVLDLILGSVSYDLNISDKQLTELTKFQKILRRVLGICFDNTTEIDVSGVGKLDQLDQVDNDIFEFNEEDELLIQSQVANILAGVVEFADCGSAKLPNGSKSSTNLLDNFNQSGLTATDYNNLAKTLLNTIADNPDWKRQYPDVDFGLIINQDFLKNIPIALMNSLLSPKHLFPLFVLSKATGNSISNEIETLEEFARIYKKYLIRVMSRIGSIFVEELVKVIISYIKILINDVINNQLNSLIRKRKKLVNTILLLINAGLQSLALVSDYRRCQSIIDELQRLLQTGLRLATLFGARIPPIINYFAYLKPGMSADSLLTRFIEKLEKQGIPTGDLPDGSPNLGLLAMQSLNESLMDEIAENGKVSVAISTKEVNGLLYGVTPIINLDGNME
jgi:hypothetical protein